MKTDKYISNSNKSSKNNIFSNLSFIHIISILFALIIIIVLAGFILFQKERCKELAASSYNDTTKLNILSNDSSNNQNHIPNLDSSIIYADNKIYNTKFSVISFNSSKSKSPEENYEDSIFVVLKLNELIYKTLGINRIKIDRVINDTVFTEWFISNSKKFNCDSRSRFIFITNNLQLKITPVLQEFKLKSENHKNKKTSHDSLNKIIKDIRKYKQL